MNQFLTIFGVSSHKELLDYINNNPEDEKVIELKELLSSLDVFFSSDGSGNNE